MNPVRALMVSHNLELEGAPNSQYELAVGLKSTGMLVPVIISPQDGPLKELYVQCGIDVKIIEPILDPAARYKKLNRNIDKFSTLLDKINPQVVYANTLQTFWAIEAAHRSRIASLWNIRESEPADTYFDFLPKKYRPLAYRCLDYPSKIIFVANATKKNWEKFESDHRMTVIHNGLDLDRFHSMLAKISREEARKRLGVNGKVVFLVMGTVSERKGQIDAIDAFKQLPCNIKAAVKILIVGDRPRDPYSAMLHDALSEVNLEHRAAISIIPETKEIGIFYAASDVALCTSRIESYPRVILEAMACGIPVISTPVFGIIEQVIENVNGIFYEPGNIAQLKDAIISLTESQSLREKMSLKSLEVFKGLTTYPQMIEKYKNLFLLAAASEIEKSSRDNIGKVLRNVRNRWFLW